MALELKYLGHSAFHLDDGTHKVVIDPFLSGNPLAVNKPEDIECSMILLTHGHADHIGDTVTIGKANAATVVGSYEISEWAGEHGLEAIGANAGGKIKTDWGWLAFTQAIHSSSYEGRYMGAACGIVLSMGGQTIYHLGDTGLFSDLKLIGEIYSPDIALVPIGDLFTMGPELATMAAEWVGAQTEVPIHYRSFPILAQDAEGFSPEGVEVKEMEPGETWSIA